jgi:hypothetical protein
MCSLPTSHPIPSLSSPAYSHAPANVPHPDPTMSPKGFLSPGAKSTAGKYLDD